MILVSEAGVTAAVGVVRGQYRTGIAVDDDRRKLRTIALAGDVAAVMAGDLAMP